jgi:hypothetical protein
VVGNTHLACGPCFETLAALAPQHEGVPGSARWSHIWIAAVHRQR